jgi:hypothetical protein
MRWWPWIGPQAQTYTRSGTGQSPGCCEVCGDPATVCVNGQQFFCWYHYCAGMQLARATQQTPNAEGDAALASDTRDHAARSGPDRGMGE